ncbi:hypothetical protein BGZ49_001881 [Haplosporangium sp. Z 27]|nr:hypothetical protein BGZ49_001881 [Haplosporangium sp. Z 27]
MATPLDSFDTLCHKVFIAHAETGFDQPPLIPTDEETALSLVSRAQVYELPSSYPIPTSFSLNATGSTISQDRRCYRIHLETVEDPIVRQSVYQILLETIDPAALLELPFDINLSGYNSNTRTESRKSVLDTPVVLDMGQISATAEEQGSVSSVSGDQQTIGDKKTMLLVSTDEWLRMSGRVRFWRQESHKIKAAKREVVLDNLLNERWKLIASLSVVSSPPPTSGSLVAGTIPFNPQSPLVSSTSSPTASSPRSSTGSQTRLPEVVVRPSTYKQILQEDQLSALAQFMTEFGDEHSATSILKGLLDLIRRQLTEEKVLSLTIDRANLTEQKEEVTVAFLDLVARLGLELVEITIDQDVDSSIIVSPPLNGGDPPEVSKKNDRKRSTDLTWTFGSKVDDRRLEYLIQNIQKSSLPALKMGTTLDSTLPLSDPSHKQHQKQQDRRKNPIPAATLKRFLQDRHTIPAGSIQNFTTKVGFSDSPSNAPVLSTYDRPVIRDRSFVLANSKYALSSSGSTSSSELFVHRVRKDVVYLARWASSCGGRLDWIWAWLLSSFYKSRNGSSSINDSLGSGRRPPRSNDENV